MPNHVTNIISFSGDPKAIQQMLESIKNDEYGLGTIDFNKIIPMPDSLDIEAGSRTDSGLKAYREFIDVYTLMGTLEKDLLHIPKESEDAFLKLRTDIKDDEWELGRTAFQNKLQYGAPTWYEWRIGHWGTKWNAYGYDEGVDYSDNDNLQFQTAWGAPHPVIAKLAEMFPDVEITHEWADENIGQNCGMFCYEDGIRMEEYFPTSNKDGIEFAARVMDASPEDWNLYLNASGRAYIYAGEDKYELVELFDKPMLFINERITKDDIPLGMYCYHLRQSDDGERFSTIEPKVAVNHGGSIISNEPIDFGKEKLIALSEDTFPNFLGQQISIGEYVRGDYEIPAEGEELGEMSL